MSGYSFLIFLGWDSESYLYLNVSPFLEIGEDITYYAIDKLSVALVCISLLQHPGFPGLIF
jgi:hypothetical protein